jgi:hypothetical protein
MSPTNAEGALGGAAQVGRQAAVALQDRSGLRRWPAPGPGWRRSEYIQITLLSFNRSFQLGVLLLQEANLFLKYLLKATREAVGHELRAVQSEDSDLKHTCWRQSVKTTGGLVLYQVRRCVVNAWMQQSAALGKIGVIGPIIAFILVAFDAGVDQVVELVAPAGGARSVMIEGELAPHSDLGHTTVAARAAIALPDGLKQGMRHDFGCSAQDR